VSSSPSRHRNLAVLVGTVAADPVARDLPSGSTVLSFDVCCDVDSGRLSVNVAWADPPPRGAAGLRAGVDVVVVGSVRRRFFRVGGATQSRTEVVVERLVRASNGRAAAAALAVAAETIGRA
jgi:single-strand DNA-binding protein